MTRAAVLIDLDDEEQRRWLLQFIARKDREALDGQRTGPQSGEAGPPASPDVTKQAREIFKDEVKEYPPDWPEGACPIHGSASWGPSNWGGFFCASDANVNEPANKKGKCRLKSGYVYEGRKVP